MACTADPTDPARLKTVDLLGCVKSQTGTPTPITDLKNT